MIPEFPAQPPTLTAAQVKAEANGLGFSVCAITSLEPLPHGEELDRWLASGKAGNMRYLHRQAKKRKNPQLADKTAKRAIVVLDSYYYESAKENNRPQVARYARGSRLSHRHTAAIGASGRLDVTEPSRGT